MQNPFSNKWFYDEGTEWLGKGRWFLPIPGTGDKKRSVKASMIGAGVFILAFLLLTVWLSWPDYTYKELPHYQTLYGVMGRTLSDVAPAVGVSQDALIEVSDGTYKLPEGAIYAGIAFELTLHFDDGLLSGYTYTAAAPADAKSAAKDIANVAEMFSIKSLPAADGTEVTMNKKALRKYLEDIEQPFAAQCTFNSISFDRDLMYAMEWYLRKLENDPNWEGRVGEYLLKHARFYCDISMEYDPDTQFVSIQIHSVVESERK